MIASLTPVVRRQLPRDVRRALVTVRREQPARARGGVPETHLLKRRERRLAKFHGKAEREPAGMRLLWGVIEKGVTPSRAAALVERHRAVAAALERLRAVHDGSPPAPCCPRLLEADTAAGRLLFEAFAGVSLSSVSDEAIRGRARARVAAKIARLEIIPAGDWTAQRWDGVSEWQRLGEVWERAGISLPAWTNYLRMYIEATSPDVAAHRDLYAEQVIVLDAEDLCNRWIDWDLAAVAPAGLDLGNFLAHERLVHAAAYKECGQSPVTSWDDIQRAYWNAGGRADAVAIAAWEAATCLRLAGLVLQRGAGDDRVERNPSWLPAPITDPGVAQRLIDDARALTELAAGKVRGARVSPEAR
ncbi:MAG: hypothetical protein ABIU54_05445 [Candidatus Eisenbacteria bacterium]